MTPSAPVVPEALTPLWRRVFDWWLVQMKHVLPPTVFFFFGFNLILFTRWMTLQEHGIPFTNFFAATLLALLVGKAVLVVDNLRFMQRFDGAPLIQPICSNPRSTGCACSCSASPNSCCTSCARAGLLATSRASLPATIVASISGGPDLVDGAVLGLRDSTRA